MTFTLISHIALPDETRRAASSLYGKENAYLKLGDRLNELLAGLTPPDTEPCTIGNKTLESSFHCAMLTVFQFVEELANRQIVEAVRARVDLKYALHLPMNNPSLDPAALCTFRKQLFTDPASHQLFQSLLERLADFGLFTLAEDQPMVTADQLLVRVCTINRFDEIVETMHRALEAVAVSDPEWLRQITIPYWYDRYNQKRRLPSIRFTDPKWIARVLQIGADIRYLIAEINKYSNPGLSSLPEIKEIRKIFAEQFITNSLGSDNQQQIHWGGEKCASCRMHEYTK